MDNAQVMVELELLLTRLYSPECSNQERVDISKTLEDFIHRTNIWKHCIYIFQNSSNEYLILYGLNVIESLIMHQWSTVTLEDRMYLKQFILEYLIANFSILPAFFRNKLVHLFVLIGRSDWPHSYPDFLDNILQLSKSQDTRSLCLSLLQTTSEELATPKTDAVSSKREKELISSLLNYIPAIIDLIVDILTAGLWLHPLYSGQSLVQTTPSSPDSLFMLQLPVNVLNSTLNCLNHLLSWIPLSANLSPKLLDITFKYASLGCLSGTDSTGHCGELGALAMDCMIELLIKNYVPNELEVFLIRLYEHSFNLLQQLTTNIPGGRNIDFARLDDRYLSKCGDFFDYFVNSHLKRVEFNTNFPVIQFLSLFYKYTFRQPEIDSFCVCLMTWNVFLDHLILSQETHANTSLDPIKHSERYKDILVTMAANVLEKIQFHCNNIELSDIDDDTIDENETEWQSFIRQNLEFVGKVSELFPLEVLQMIIPLLDEYSKVYLSLSQMVTQQGKGRYLSVRDGDQCKTLHAVLKDLTTVLQAIGRLSEHFSGENFINQLEQTQKLMNKFCIIAKYSTDNQLFNVETPMPEILDQGFIEVHCQVLGTIVAYQHWLSQLHLSVLQGKQSEEILHYFVSSALESALPLVSHDVPEKIALSGCRLFESITATIRSHFLIEYPIVQNLLLKSCSGLLDSLPIHVLVMVYKSIVAMLVLPWTNTADDSQDWNARLSKLKTVMDKMMEPYYQYLTNAQFQQSIVLQGQAKPVIKKTMFILQEIVSAFPHEGKRSKKLVYLSIRPCVVESVPLLCGYIGESDVLDQLMSFFFVLFKTFHGQVDAGLTNEVTQTFMSLLTKDHLESTILDEGSVGNSVVIRFIDVLKLLIQDVSNSEKVLLPNVISFATKQLYPVLKNKDAPDLKVSFYSLLFHLLFDNWRYFYPSNILAKMNIDVENVQHEDDFIVMMEAFGQSFVEADINVFRENITALRVLHDKRKLFFKANFRSTMWEPFLNVFVQVLMQKSHSLLQDEISEMIYQLASVDFMHFHSDFFPKFIGNIQGLTQQQKLSLVENYQIVEDHPSFTQNLTHLTTDVRFYLTHNTTELID